MEVPSRFTHDVVRAGDKVFVCDTGNGRILEYSFPSMELVRLEALAMSAAGCARCAAGTGACNAGSGWVLELPAHPPPPPIYFLANPRTPAPLLQVRAMPLFTLKDHVNTLAPLRPNEMLAVLHNLGNVRGGRGHAARQSQRLLEGRRWRAKRAAWRAKRAAGCGSEHVRTPPQSTHMPPPHPRTQSDVVRVDTTADPPAVIGRVQGIGKKAHGLVKWHNAYITLGARQPMVADSCSH